VQEGVYWSKIYGPSDKRVQAILLDARYFRGPLKKGYDSREPAQGYRGKDALNTVAMQLSRAASSGHGSPNN